MTLAIIAALDEHNGIGYQNQLPWRLPDDLTRFKALTMGHYIIMGRKTWESIGRLLPGRKMIVVSRQVGYSAPGCIVASSFDEAASYCAAAPDEERFVIGGAQIFALAIHKVDKLYLTKIHALFPADVFFPEYNPDLWQVNQIIHHPADERHAHAFSFLDLSRKLVAD